MDCSLPGSSVHGILQARVLEWVKWCEEPIWKRRVFHDSIYKVFVKLDNDRDEPQWFLGMEGQVGVL